MDILSRLFGSGSRVKLLRLFLLNTDSAFDVEEVARRAKVSPATVRREIAMFERIGLVRRRTIFRELSRGGKKRVQGWMFYDKFPYYTELYRLLVNIPPLGSGEVVRRLSRVGRIKLLVLSGIFIQNPDSRVDMLIVGDQLKTGALENVMRALEADVGKELRYTAFNTEQFRYRLGIYDKLVRDILDYPHETVVDRLGIAVR
jgi:hypothetical protein